MESNPIVERQQQAEAEHRAQESFRYPFRITCIYHTSDDSDFPVVRDVREYCQKNNLIFLSRQYDIDKYEEDMEIRRLPAFHMYYKGYVQDRQYYDTDPIHKIQLLVWAYQDVERAKERARIQRQERWSGFGESIKSFFSLERFKKKPALDLEQSLSHTRFSNTAGTPSADRHTPAQKQLRGSPPEPVEIDRGAGTGLRPETTG
jgi:hypothetical protein